VEDWLFQAFAILGATTGPLGLLLGFMAYRRDRARVQISAVWKPKSWTGRRPWWDDDQIIVGLIKVYNPGRQSTFIEFVAIGFKRSPSIPSYLPLYIERLSDDDFPNGEDRPRSFELAPRSMSLKFKVREFDLRGALELLEQTHSNPWWSLRPIAVDASNRVYQGDRMVRSPQSFGFDEKYERGWWFYVPRNRLMNWLGL